MSTHDKSVIDRTGQFLEYLASVARELQTKPVRDFRSSTEYLTGEDIPEHTRIRLGPSASNPAWLRVPRLSEDEPPQLPDSLEGLVEPESLDNLAGLPELKQESHLASDEDRLMDLEEWTESQWLPWAMKTQPIRQTRDLYQRLLQLRLSLQRQQASHELVWGNAMIGLRKGGGVLAPLLVTPMQIHLDDDTGELIVTPESETLVELDALEGLGLDFLPDLTTWQTQVAQGFAPDPWHPETFSEFLQKLTHPMGVDAQFRATVSLPDATSAPTITEAWALIARPRPKRHERFYNDLAQVLREEQFLPMSLAAVVAEENELRTVDRWETPGDRKSWDAVAERILMPLPANDDQERIVLQLARERGVTVQGPPGTGKSHTIVNLVSHLIAHGKRVLVTAQNEQALEVLRQKFPRDLRDLTISVLGSTPDAMDELRASLQAVLAIASETDVQFETAALNDLGQRLDEARKRERLLQRQLVEALSHEEAEFDFGHGPKSAPDVAKWLASNSTDLGKITDEIDPGLRCPLSTADFVDFVRLCEQLAPEDIAACQRVRPRLGELPTVESLETQSRRIVDLRDQLADLEDAQLNVDAARKYSLQELQALADRVEQASRQLVSIRSDWCDRLARSMLDEVNTPGYWTQVIRQARDEVDSIQGIRREQVGHQITLPEGDPRELEDRLAELAIRFEQGKGVPRFAKSSLRQFLNGCEVDGYTPRTTEDVELLKKSLAMRQHVRRLHQLLAEASADLGFPLPEQDQHFLKVSKEIVTLMAQVQEWTATDRPALQDSLSPLFTRDQDVDSVENLQRLAYMLRQAAAHQELAQLEESLQETRSKIEKSSNINKASPIWRQLLSSLSSWNWSDWRTATDEIQRLEVLDEQVARFTTLEMKLASAAPVWTEQITSSGGDFSVIGEPEHLDQMWAWARTKSWIAGLHSGATVATLVESAETLQTEISRLVLDIARRSASVGVTTNLDGSKQKALVAWQQAIQKRGKGKGKHAAHWEQVARQELPKAMGAIPAWIMPIHRIIENFQPGISDLFDVVIVDESSQCDLLSSGVLALATKCVVVGDDKQVSPMTVGVDPSRIRSLQDIYLGGVHSRELLTADQSLYELAALVFPSVILLKEHFRCVPEIINFSNRYYDNRILPLREPPDYDLGTPTRAVFVEDAVREGAGNNVINRPEAARMVETIRQCHMDPQYEGLTFGVVSLQGQQQSRLIEQMLIDELGFEAFEDRALRAGTPQDFQGDERNVVFISVVADDARYSAVKTADKQRTNVAASRAQDQLWVFYSVDPSTLHPDDQRRALIEYVANGGRSYRPNPNDLAQCDSDFERDVLHDIHAKGYDVIPQYPVGKFRIDLVVQHQGGRLAVECDGDRFHGAEQYENDIRRQRVLERMGWKFWRIRASEYYLNPTSAMASLWELLGRRERTHVSIRRPENQVAGQEHSSSESGGMAAAAERPPQDAEDANFEMSYDDQSPNIVPIEEEEQDTLLDGVSEADTFIFAPTTEPDYDFGDGSRGLWILIDEEESVAGTPMIARDETGAREVEGIRTPCRFVFDDVAVNFSVISWSTGSGEVVCDDLVNAGRNLMRLLHGGRLGIYATESGARYAEVRIMRPGSNGLPTAQIPHAGELREVLGWSLNQLLEIDMGVERIGTRADVIEDKGPRRNTKIALWRDHSVDIPAMIYLTTRIIPLMALDGDY